MDIKMKMNNLEILIEDLREDDFLVKKGQAKAILPEERNEPEYDWLETASRDFDIALRERIQIPYENGRLITRVREEDGTTNVFDDRKLRYAGHVSSNGVHTLYVAPTHFREIMRTNIRATKDKEFRDYLLQRGLQDFNDRWAYFASPFCINAIPVTADGYVHVLKRSEKAVIWPGHWHIVGGLIDSDSQLFEKENPHETMKGLIKKTVGKELEEEVGAENFKLKFLALIRSLSAVDFAHIAHIQASSKEFLSGVKKAAEAYDHTDVRVLKSDTEVYGFLKKETKIVPAGRYSLYLYLKRN